MAHRNRLLFVVFLLLVNLFAWQEIFALNQNRFLKVDFFDVGQGEAIFIETPQRRQILIDGGPDSKVTRKLAEVMPFWDRTIDLVVLTHPEKDHMAGLIEVFKRYKVQRVLWTGVVRDTAEYAAWDGALQKEGAEIFTAKSGQKIKDGEISFDILFPFEDLAGKKFNDSNDTSIVARLSFGADSFLFTGDITSKIEKALIAKNTLIGADVLKVGHHGSKTSTSFEFLEKVNPEAAVISAGRNNSYGHPHGTVLDNLAKYGIEIFRTDLTEDIKIISDGKKINISE